MSNSRAAQEEIRREPGYGAVAKNRRLSIVFETVVVVGDRLRYLENLLHQVIYNRLAASIAGNPSLTVRS